MKVQQRKLKSLRQLFLAIILLFILGACTPSENEPQNVPTITPDVPSLQTVTQAIERWNTGNNTTYYVEVEETINGETTLIRVVVDDNAVRAAQKLQRVSGEWQPPVTFAFDEAEKYTVDALLERVRKDATGEGDVPFNMLAIFDPTLGFPSVIDADALPSTNETGKVQLNREYSYALGVNVDVLIEETVGFSKEVLLELTRSGGEAAWCDKLKIFTDGSSAYTDECRRTLLQNNPPRPRLEEIQELAGAFAAMDTYLNSESESQHLVIVGTGTGEPSPENIETAWEYADALHDLLSKPIGAGLTMLYYIGEEVFGFDMRSLVGQPGAITPNGLIIGMAVEPAGNFLAYSDTTGVRTFDLSDGDNRQLLMHPADGVYKPISWGADQKLLIATIPAGQETITSYGWAEAGKATFNEIANTFDGETIGCPTGAAWSPDGAQLLIAAAAEGAGCAGQGGLFIVDFTNGTGDVILSDEVGRIASPAWSYEEDVIAVAVQPDAASAHTQIFTLNSDGTDVTRVTDSVEGQAAYPVWSPDGTLYYTLNGAETGENGVYVYDPNAGSHFLLTPGDDLETVSVAPTEEFMVIYSLEGLHVWMFAFEQRIPIAGVRGNGDVPEFGGWLQAQDN